MSRCDTPESATITIVPNQPKTPVRTFRLDTLRWTALKTEALRRGVSVSDLLREAVDLLLGIAQP